MQNTALQQNNTAAKRSPQLITLTLIGIAALLAAPYLMYPLLLMKVLVFILFACAFNLMFGFGGMLSFGHAAFFGMSAYVAGYSAKAWGAPFELAVLAGTLTAAALGLVFGLLAIRRQGIYFAMITLALAQMVYYISLRSAFTGGEDGIQNIPRGTFLGVLDLSSSIALYYVVLGLVLAGMFLIQRVVKSPFGNILKAIRDNEPRAVSLGYDVNKHKILAFVLSAGLSGLAGALKVFIFQIATLSDVYYLVSAQVVLMALLGGTLVFWGPALGAVIIVLMQSYLAPLGAWVTIVQGAILVTCVVIFRDGIVGFGQRVYKRIFGRRDDTDQVRTAEQS